MACPKHSNSDGREEHHFDENGTYHRTFFCNKCLSHYKLCKGIIYMSQCCKIDGHEGNHLSKNGREWDDDDNYK